MRLSKNPKYSFGTLNESDVDSINNLLEKSISTSATTWAPEISTLTKKENFIPTNTPLIK